MVDVSDSGLAAAYNNVVDDTDPTDWLVAGYSEDKKKIIIKHSGSHGLSELREHLSNHEIQFAYLRLVITDEKSKKTKFALISWTGKYASIADKAKATIHKADVIIILKNFSNVIHAGTTNDLDDETVTTLLSMSSP